MITRLQQNQIYQHTGNVTQFKSSPEQVRKLRQEIDLFKENIKKAQRVKQVKKFLLWSSYGVVAYFVFSCLLLAMDVLAGI